MPRISQLTTEAPASTSDLVLNVGSTTRRANVQQILSVPVTAQGDMLFGDSSADSTRLAPPTSGAILAYSSASSTPSWSIPTSGAVLVASSVGLPTWRAIGTSGQILESTGGTPTWVTAVDPSTGHITTAGTSGQILETTGGAATWVTPTNIVDNRWSLVAGTTQPLSVGAWQVSTIWQVEEFDPSNMHTTGTGASSIVVATSGTYLIGVSLSIGHPTSGGFVGVRIMEGSTELTEVSFLGPGTAEIIHLSAIRNFASSGSVITIDAYRDGTTGNISNPSVNRFWGHRLS